MSLIKSSKIGLKNIHIAEYDIATHRWTLPVPLRTVKSMTLAANISQGEEYNDDQLFEVFDALENFTATLTFTDLSPSEEAFLYGWQAVGGAYLQGSDDTPPWIALMGERQKADGTYRLFKYYKGKARMGGWEAQTKGASISAQPDSVTIVFGPLDEDFPLAAYKRKASIKCDESDVNYAGEYATWFNDVVPGRTAP